MNWLLTYCDGASGYKTASLLTQVGASIYLQKVEGIDKETADLMVNQNCIEAIICHQSEQILYPVPTEATDDPGVDDEF